MVAASLGAVIMLDLVGWLAWTQGAMVGLRFVEFDSPLSLAALGFLAGIGGFFAPCAFALFPAYVSYYLTASGGHTSAARSLGLGLSCAAGAAVFFALVGTAITLVGGVVSPYLIATKPVIALAVVGFGVVQMLDIRMPSLALPLPVTVNRGVPSAVTVFPVSSFSSGVRHGAAATRPQAPREAPEPRCHGLVDGRAGRRPFCGGAPRDPDLNLCRPSCPG